MALVVILSLVRKQILSAFGIGQLFMHHLFHCLDHPPLGGPKGSEGISSLNAVDDVTGFFLTYADDNLKKELEVKKNKIKVKYLHYDWSLNGK